MKKIGILLSISFVILSCSNSRVARKSRSTTEKEKAQISSTNKETFQKKTEHSINKIGESGIDSMLYITKTHDVRKLIEIKLITKKEFESVPAYQNKFLKKFDNRIIEEDNNNFSFKLNNGTYKKLYPEKDYYCCIGYIGNIDKKNLYLLYIEDDDNEAPYGFYSSITGNLIRRMGGEPSLSPKGNYFVTIEGMNYSFINILKINKNNTITPILETEFSYWEKKDDKLVRWVNNTTFVLEIEVNESLFKNEEKERTKYISIIIL